MDSRAAGEVHFMEGYRVALLDDQILVCYRKHHPRIIGDGISTVRQLIQRFNETSRHSGDDRTPPLDPDRVPPFRSMRAWRLEDIPAAGEVLEFDLETNNLSRGAWPEVIANPHPHLLKTAWAAHRALHLRYSGVDVRWPRQDAPPVVLEVNGNPGFDHLAAYDPALGESIAETVARAVLSRLGPEQSVCATDDLSVDNSSLTTHLT